MNNFVIDTPDNFWQIRWLDKYMEGHKGFIAGGCFKNILSGERVKDIVHNPALIYKLSKLDCVNFIEMTEGYLNKTCTFVSN